MKKYILYAEDDEEDFELLKKALVETNSEIELFRVISGYEVIEFLQKRDANAYPCLLLMDMKMPLLSGIETIELLKQDDRFKSIPTVLFSTSSGSPSEEKEIFESNTELIKKPFIFREWLAIAKEIMKYCSALMLFVVA